MLSHAFSLADVVCGRVSEYTKGCSCWRLLFFSRHSFAANFPDDLQTYSIPQAPFTLSILNLAYSTLEGGERVHFK